MSSRWSYGPEGLRERPVARWSDAALLPRWRDLQPVLIRSAGVVGIVATIMAVVSSDALNLGADEPTALAAVEPLGPAVIPPDVELRAAPELATTPPSAEAAPPSEPLAAESRRAAEPVAEPTAPPAQIVVASADEELALPEPAATKLAPEVADFALAEAPDLALEPVGAASSGEPRAKDESRLEVAPDPSQAADAEAIVAMVQPTVAVSTPEPSVSSTLAAELRSGATPAPAPTVEVATTASVAAPVTDEAAATVSQGAPDKAQASLSPDAGAGPPAEISLAALRSSDTPAASADAENLAWPNEAATCPRDWVVAEEGSRSDDGGADCMATASLFAPVAEDLQAALEEAAAEEAMILASLPRVPLPRPEPPADFEPSNPHKTVRVNSRNSSWPAEPPPNCAAGQRAKWRFVDRRAGTKEWYCR